MSGKYALVIANTEYTDPGLAQLKAPGQDAKAFWRVLSSPDLCAFTDVMMLLNEDSYKVAERIEVFFEKKKPDDLLLLFFSGHGVKDENGALYLAVRNTNRSRLRSTAIASDFIRSVMDECRSRRQVLILDCCNSGAFAQGTKAETGGSIGTATAFKGTGYGRVILTASDSTQFAWEGDKVIGETENSLFTHFIIKGLEGEADRSGEGHITLDDLYDYAYEQIVSITPKQTPGKWSFKQQGEILLREHIRVEDVSPLPLPAELLDEIEDKRPYVREAALQRLAKLANGKNLRLARSAREALERMAENDDSRTISRMALQALETIKQVDANIAANITQEQAAKAEADRLAAQKVEAERLAKQQADEERLARLELERKAKEETDRIARQKAKEEADRLAAQKAEADRLEKQKAEDELAAKAKAEKERKAKEEADRLAAQKAEADRLAKQKAEAERLARLEAERKAKQALAAKTKAERERKAKERAEGLAAQKAKSAALLASFTSKIPASRTVLFGVAAVAVLAIAGIGIRAFSNTGTTTVTETPALPATSIPSTQAPTDVSETPTLETIIPLAGPPMEVGSTYSYVDGSLLVAVPAGEFTMGSSGTDNPAHEITLDDYWIYSTEVTNQQYAFCVSLGQCALPDLNDNPRYSDYKLANDPITGVTYEQAVNYCEFVNGRLPSEAEWEKAAQSQQGGSYPWGEAAPSCDLLNFNNCLDAMARVVDYSEGASQYGALNMSGNVFEWVADWYDDTYYTGSPNENPPGPTSGTLRAVRSSSYASDADNAAVAIRNSESPQNHRPDLGFRCVVDEPTYFAPFCELPSVYAGAASQDESSLETCPELAIKPVLYCNNNIPLNNVTFVGPSEAAIDAQDCIPSSNPNLFTCKTKGATVSISAACQLNDPGDASCLDGYSEQSNFCVVDTAESQTARSCLAGDYNSTGLCCAFPKEGMDGALALQVCPVGTFYAAQANACLPQPVRELVSVSLEVALPSACTTTSGGGGGGGGGGSSGGGGGGCQATQAQIDSCNAQAPFYQWNSASCSCDPQ